MLVPQALRAGYAAATNAVRGTTTPLADQVSLTGSFTDPEFAQVGLSEAKARELHDVVKAVVYFEEPALNGPLPHDVAAEDRARLAIREQLAEPIRLAVDEHAPGDAAPNGKEAAADRRAYRRACLDPDGGGSTGPFGKLNAPVGG